MDPLAMTKRRDLLPQQCKTERAVILGQATGPPRPVFSLQQQPEADAWERFKNRASTYKMSLQPPAAQGLPKPEVAPMHLVTPSNLASFPLNLCQPYLPHPQHPEFQSIQNCAYLICSLTKQTGRREKHKGEILGKEQLKTQRNPFNV